MSIEKVREYFKEYRMDGRILEFDTSSATVELAAEALGCSQERIAKSLSFYRDGDPCIIVVCAGDAKIDNSKYKAEFGMKAKMLPYDLTGELTGHSAGGVCPFAVKDGVAVYLDVSLKRFDTVFPACGSSNSAIEITIPELEKYSGYIKWVDVCKAWNTHQE